MQTYRVEPNPEPTNDVPSQSLQDQLRTAVEAIAYPRHAWTQPKSNRRACEWIADQFASLGFDVRLQGDLRNVVAYPRRPESPLILVGAHYDSVPTTPGADDNASGIAVLLQAAQALAGHTNIGFVAFNCEEDGLAGSTDFVNAHRQAPRVEIDMIHVLEMVGFTAQGPNSQRSPIRSSFVKEGDFVAIASDRQSRGALDGVLSEACRIKNGPPVVALRSYLNPALWAPDLLRSDHGPFWKAGIRALLWTDTAEFRNPNYHQPTDTPETLDYAFMASVFRLLVASCRSRKP